MPSPSEYDLTCDRCKQKHAEIFKDADKQLVDEEKLYWRWIRELCPECKRLLAHYGFHIFNEEIVEELEPYDEIDEPIPLEEGRAMGRAMVR